MASTLGSMVSIASLKLGDASVGEYYLATSIKQAIGDAYRKYVMLLIKMGAGYFEATTNLNITGGTETISLASLSPAFWKVSLVEKYVTNGRVPLKPYERRYEFMPTTGVGGGDTYLPTYKFRSQNMVLEPPPGASETAGIKLDYVYLPTFPSSSSADAFTFDAQFPAIYETNVILRACIKLLEEKDAIGGVSDIATFRAELADLDKDFEDTMELDEIPDEISYAGEDYGNIYR